MIRLNRAIGRGFVLYELICQFLLALSYNVLQYVGEFTRHICLSKFNEIRHSQSELWFWNVVY